MLRVGHVSWKASEIKLEYSNLEGFKPNGADCIRCVTAAKLDVVCSIADPFAPIITFRGIGR